MKSSSFGWYRVLFIILAILYIFAGIALVANPAAFSTMIISMIGWLAVFYGLTMIAGYFMAVNFKSIWTMVFGIFLLILGLLVAFNPFKSATVIGVMVAVGFIAAGLFRLYQAFMVKDLGVSTWWLVLILAACSLIIGCIMIFNVNDPLALSELVTILIGTNLLVNGVSDLVLGFTAF